ncbi:uncharacterized protein KGF55_001470 [Candida pseudojiufengensis]|uniref:uncharacterized protein n=1 Tax=Candida pseudojiufengensis TaxID=497109 RepID=UPI002224469D|nr:uncharacterized protein KGF55_001470 [Candida pseudojiufengensis]KAI5965250.1 hypothetical protein KGF55_001470 [Candida pseudojiufengensis]
MFKYNDIYSIIILLFSISSYAYALLDPPTIATNERGLVCSPVQLNPKNPLKSYIKLRTSSLREPEIKDKLKIEALIFHYPDIVNFTSIPTLEEYTTLYPKDKESLYKKMLTDDDKFDLTAESGFEVDKSKIYEGDLTTTTEDIIYQIPQSGIYCVYIAPIFKNKQDEKLSLNFKVPIVFKNYYGNLAYPIYLVYSQLKYTIVVSIIMFIVLFNYILRFKIGENFKNLNSISVISKGVLFLILAPFIVICIYNGFVFWLINSFLETDEKSFIITVLLFISETAEFIYSNFRSYIVLLFSMGFGVIYYYNGNSQNYRLFPQDSFRKITALLFFNIGLVIFTNLLNYLFPTTKNEIFGMFANVGSSSTTLPFNGKDKKTNFMLLLNTLVSLFQLCWFILSIVFYFKTKKTIATFPSSSDFDSNAKVTSAFNKSFFVIMILPIITAIVGASISGYFAVQNFDKFPDFPQNTNREPVYQSAITVMILENALGKFIMPLVYSGLFYFFCLILSIFFIWIKDNNGLIYCEDDPVAYADVSNFNISDDEDYRDSPNTDENETQDEEEHGRV